PDFSQLSWSADATVLSGVGDYAILTPGELLGNYRVTNQTATPLLHVTPAPLTVTIDSMTRAWSDPNPLFTFSLTGLVNDDSLASLGLTPGTTATAASDIGNYAIRFTGPLANANYFFESLTPGTLSVVPLLLQLNAGNSRSIYGDTPLFGATFRKLNSIDTGVYTIGATQPAPGVTVYSDSTVTARSNVGDYSVLYGVTGGGANVQVQGDGSFTHTVDPAKLNASFSLSTTRLIVGDIMPSVVVTASGLRNGDLLSDVLSYSYTIPALPEAGKTYTVTLAALLNAPAGASRSNYVFASAPPTGLNFELQKRTLLLKLPAYYVQRQLVVPDYSAYGLNVIGDLTVQQARADLLNQVVITNLLSGAYLDSISRPQTFTDSQPPTAIVETPAADVVSVPPGSGTMTLTLLPKITTVLDGSPPRLSPIEQIAGYTDNGFFNTILNDLRLEVTKGTTTGCICVYYSNVGTFDNNPYYAGSTSVSQGNGLAILQIAAPKVEVPTAETMARAFNMISGGNGLGINTSLTLDSGGRNAFNLTPAENEFLAEALFTWAAQNGLPMQRGPASVEDLANWYRLASATPEGRAEIAGILAGYMIDIVRRLERGNPITAAEQAFLNDFQNSARAAQEKAKQQQLAEIDKMLSDYGAAKDEQGREGWVTYYQSAYSQNGLLSAFSYKATTFDGDTSGVPSSTLEHTFGELQTTTTSPTSPTNMSYIQIAAASMGGVAGAAAGAGLGTSATVVSSVVPYSARAVLLVGDIVSAGLGSTGIIGFAGAGAVAIGAVGMAIGSLVEVIIAATRKDEYQETMKNLRDSIANQPPIDIASLAHLTAQGNFKDLKSSQLTGNAALQKDAQAYLDKGVTDTGSAMILMYMTQMVVGL
ncbi:MAG: hypothetical protein LBV50_11775, partial [Novosphingobium sp.]|nr:hypothetical protein [Novosphingobium sp.]